MNTSTYQLFNKRANGLFRLTNTSPPFECFTTRKMHCVNMYVVYDMFIHVHSWNIYYTVTIIQVKKYWFNWQKNAAKPHSEPDCEEKLGAGSGVSWLGGFTVARGRPLRQTRECEPRPESCSWLNGLVSRPGSLPQSPRQVKLSKATKLATRLEGGARGRCWHWHQRGERWHSDAKARLQFTSLTSGGRLVQDLPGARALCRSVSLHQPQLRGWEWILADKSWT